MIIKSTRLSHTLFACIALFTHCSMAAYIDIPKTGQINTLENYDDGAHKKGLSWPSPRFTDNADGTITDNLSGLMWIKDLGCAASSSYVSGAVSQNWEDIFQFVSQLNSKELKLDCQQYNAEYSDWRAPNIQEILTLFRAGLSSNQTIRDWLIEPESPSGRFSNNGFLDEAVWTSTTDASDDSRAWVIDLVSGQTYTESKTSNNFYYIFSAVRNTDNVLAPASGQKMMHHAGDDGAIQAGIAQPAQRFVARDDGSIVDKFTGLAWFQNVSCLSPNLDWSQAIDYIQAQNFAELPFGLCNTNTTEESHTDWRLPNLNELKSLIDYSHALPALADNHGFSLPLENRFWTSTSSNTDPGLYAWMLDLDNGIISSQQLKSNFGLYPWPVRGPVDYPDISSDVEEIRFGSYYVNQEVTESHEVVISNPGTSTLMISSTDINPVNSSANEFSIGRDQCSNRNLEHKETCILEIRFVAKATGLRVAKLHIESNALGSDSFDQVSIYGKGLGEDDEGNSACFIATAAYGSYLEDDVQVLRTFRDRYLLSNILGKQLVDYYYQTSPAIARLIAESEPLKTATRILLTPLIFTIKHPYSLSIMLLLLLALIQRRYAHK